MTLKADETRCGYCKLKCSQHPAAHCPYTYEPIKHPLNGKLVGYEAKKNGQGS
jgi:hypothetical protein